MLKMNGQGERKEKIKPASEVGARLAGLWKKTGARIVNAAKALDPSLPEGAALAAKADNAAAAALLADAEHKKRGSAPKKRRYDFDF